MRFSREVPSEPGYYWYLERERIGESVGRVALRYFDESELEWKRAHWSGRDLPMVGDRVDDGVVPVVGGES